MPDDSFLDAVIQEGRETRSVEFKRSMNWENEPTKAKVVKACLALANLRDGGVIVFGLTRDPESRRYVVTGMPEDDFRSFDQDGVSSVVNSYASPSIALDVFHHRVDDHQVVAIAVQSFDNVPIICGKALVRDGRTIISKGRLLCRSKRMPESTEVQEPDDLREILDLATQKALKRYATLRSLEQEAEPNAHAQQFRDQLGEDWAP